MKIIFVVSATVIFLVSIFILKSRSGKNTQSTVAPEIEQIEIHGLTKDLPLGSSIRGPMPDDPSLTLLSIYTTTPYPQIAHFDTLLAVFENETGYILGLRFEGSEPYKDGDMCIFLHYLDVRGESAMQSDVPVVHSSERRQELIDDAERKKSLPSQ
jgi:hypothetical protein